MPVYEYRCGSCGATYDVLHKGREIAEDIVCPSCASTEHKRLISVPAAATFASAGDASCAPGGCCGGSCGVD